MKTEKCHLFLESFKYFCQISSKLILTILSYTVSKLVHFLRHSVETDLSTTQQSVLHNSYELLVTEFTVTVGVKQLEDHVYDVTVQQLTSTRLHSALELA